MPAGMLIAASSAFAAEVTSDRLLNADREPQNWLMNHRTGERANANLVAGSNLAICRREVEPEQFWPLAGPDIHSPRWCASNSSMIHFLGRFSSSARSGRSAFHSASLVRFPEGG
jgi:hypothetical protein